MSSDGADDGQLRRRLVGLLFVVLLVLLGIGLVTLPEGGSQTAQLGGNLTVSTPTPTPGGGGANGQATTPDTETTPGDQTPTDETVPTPSGVSTPAEGTPTPNPDGPSEDDADNDGGTGGGGGGGGGGGSDGGGDDTARSVDVEVVGPSARIQYDDVLPGDSARERLILRNEGDAAGRLALADVAVSDLPDETGTEGDLSEHLLVTVEAEDEDGNVRYLYGTGSGPRSLRALGDDPSPAAAGVVAPGEEVTVVLDWHLPVGAPNGLQGDAVVFDLTFAMEET